MSTRFKIIKLKKYLIITLHISESIWPPPFSTGVCRNEEPSPEGQRDKEISLSQFILSLFEGVGQLLPGDFAGLLMSRPRLLAAGDSCCQKVPQRFSGSIQGDALLLDTTDFRCLSRSEIGHPLFLKPSV